MATGSIKASNVITTLTGGNMSTSYNAIGVQFDANRILCIVYLPFYTNNVSYTISDIGHAVVLGEGNYSGVTVDGKGLNWVRFSIPHSNSNVGCPYIVNLLFKITL